MFWCVFTGFAKLDVWNWKRIDCYSKVGGLVVTGCIHTLWSVFVRRFSLSEVAYYAGEHCDKGERGKKKTAVSIRKDQCVWK